MPFCRCHDLGHSFQQSTGGLEQRADATEVEITFVDRGHATRVEIEHRGWERLGALDSQWRNANRAGWTSLLPHFQTACAA